MSADDETHSPATAMTAADDLSRDLTAALLAVPGVAEVYAPRSAVLLVAQQVVEEAVTGSAPATEHRVTVDSDDAGVHVRTSIAVDAAGRASEIARAAVDALRATLAGAVGERSADGASIEVRVGSID